VIEASQELVAERVQQALAKHELFQLIKPCFGADLQLYLVGGGVRDVALGRSLSELDLVVVGDATELAKQLALELNVEYLAHEQFKTATVKFEIGSLDLASARSESYPAPAWLPEVTLTQSIEDDLRRRDFTVNSIAIGVSKSVEGRVYAVENAFEDLTKKQLRVLHANSFSDDPTRLFRLVRYLSRLDFKVEIETMQLLKQALVDHRLDQLSGHRIGSELLLILQEKDPVKALRAFADLGLAKALKLTPVVDTELLQAVMKKAAVEAEIEVLLLGACYLEFEEDQLESWLQTLGYDRLKVEKIVFTSRAKQLSLRLKAANCNSQIATVLREQPVEATVLASCLGSEKEVDLWNDQLSKVKLEIDGEELIEAGVEPGPLVGKVLNRVLAEKLDGKLFGHSQELESALRSIGSSGGSD